MTPQTDIQNYLGQLKAKLGVFGVAFRKRDKNLSAFDDLNISPKQRVDFLKDLKPEDYCSGPNPDRDIPDRPDYYEFGIVVNGKEVNIKLTIGLINKPVDCISFHVAEWPMKYPLKPTTL